MTLKARLHRYWLEHWVGPLHTCTRFGPCHCWEDQGLRRPQARR